MASKMRKLIAILSRIYALFIFLILFVRLMGSGNTQALFISFIGKDAQIVDGLWCWRKICPGRTTVAEAKRILLGIGEFLVRDRPDELRIEYGRGASIEIVNFQGRPEIIGGILIKLPDAEFSKTFLADMIVTFGTPKLIQREVAPGRAVWQRDICFDPILCIYVNGTEPRIDLNLLVTEIDFLSEEERPYSSYNDSYYNLWRGFVTLPSR